MLGHVCNPHCALCSHIFGNILCMFSWNKILGLGGDSPKLSLERKCLSEVVSSWANPKFGVLHEQPKKDWILQGWIFEADCLRLTLVRGRYWVLEIYSHRKRGGFFCLFLPGREIQSLRKVKHFSLVDDDDLCFHLLLLLPPSFNLQHSLPTQTQKKKYFKILFSAPLFTLLWFFYFIFFYLSLVPVYGESSWDINIDADLGY